MQQRSFLDQMGNLVTIHFPPRRIISLVPSQTELLADLDLDDEIVGITKFCIHPQAWGSPKNIVGGTKNFHLDEIAALDPDLIIANKEENYQEGIASLKKNYPVWLSDIVSLEDALAMITSLGEMTNRKVQSGSIVSAIQETFSTIKKYPAFSVLYLIWRGPWMAAGKGTFINTMLGKAGLRNVLDQDRYPELSAEDIKMLRPDYIFLSSEPYPFREKHMEELQQISPDSRILLVDGEMFSWYGSRLIKAPAYFNALGLGRP
jgi:ABC-type Fe3+-hydroxamate transport system substrate-binding protein